MNYYDNYYSGGAAARMFGEKKGIKMIGQVAGICVIAYIVTQNIFTLPFVFPALNRLYHDNQVFQYCVGILLSFLCILVPFLIGGVYLRKRTGADIAPLEKPQSMPVAVLLILIGLFLCVAGDYVTSWTVYLFRLLGFELSSPDAGSPTGVFERTAYVIYVAFTAPLCEEIAVRGVIMQPLRRYGDAFAIVVSSVVFGVLHGNLIQAPFAFVAGLGMGYAVCISGSLWPSIIIHFINNLFASVSLFMQTDLAPEVFESRYNLINYSMLAAGILGAIGFCFINNRNRLKKSETLCSAGSKASAFFLNVPMILALLAMAFITSFYIKRS